ncbi:winged helix DNA-binding domain-containing protein [soil metagenome]
MAVQAQEFAEAKWSLAERIEGEPTDAEIEGAFARGEIIRTHVLRPTWHFVAPEDLRWMLELTAPRVRQTMGYYNRQLKLDDATLERAAGLMREQLSGSEPQTRKDLGKALALAGIDDPSGGRLNHMVMYAELGAVLCSAPRRGKQFTYRLVDEAVPDTEQLSRDQALAELARRFFTSHGPATITDFSWWSGLTKTDCRAGLAAIEGDLAQEPDDDGEPWIGPNPKRDTIGTEALLIPMYDELSVGFRDLRMVFDSQPPDGLMARPILFDGVCFGSWRRTIGRGEVTVEVTTFKRLSRSHRAQLAQVAERFGRFLELPARLETTVASA